MTKQQFSKAPSIIFKVSIAVCGFWILSQLVNVYRFAVVGALFEILWLPMFALLYALPVVSFIFLIRDKFRFRSLYLYSFLINLITLLFITLGN
jgi:ABC-type transport system involved in cytochrome c biogenesis permease subunit